MPNSIKNLQNRFVAIHDNGIFQTVVISVILLSALVIGANTYEIDPQWRRMISVLDTTITLFFLSKYRVPSLVRICVYLLIMIQQLFILVLALAGLFDQWADFRKIHRRRI